MTTLKENDHHSKLKRGPNFAGIRKSADDNVPDLGLRIEASSPTKLPKADIRQLMQEIDYKGMNSKSPSRIVKGPALTPKDKTR